MADLESKSNQKKNYFTLLDYIQVFWDNKKFILISTLVVTIITVLILLFVVKPVFLSVGTVKSTKKTSNLAGLLSVSGLSGIEDISDIAGGGAGATELALYEQILTSRRCLEETIIKFNLMEEFNEKYMQTAVKRFREDILELSKDKIAGTLTIGIYDENPERAKEIADFLIHQLNIIFSELSVTEAKNNREFIEKRYNLVLSDLKNAEDSLKSYQDIYGIAPDIVAKSVTQASVQLETEIKSEEVKLDLLRKILNPNQSEILMQEEKIKALKNQLNDITNNSDNKTFLSLKGVPAKIINYIRLQRNVEIQNKLLTFLIPIYEQAKIEEKKDTPVVLILDKPYIPEKKAKPKRIIVTFIITSLWFFGSYSTIFLYRKFKDLHIK